jgi:hypothetical protein
VIEIKFGHRVKKPFHNHEVEYDKEHPAALEIFALTTESSPVFYFYLTLPNRPERVAGSMIM